MHRYTYLQLGTKKVLGVVAQLVHAAGEQFVYSLETRDVVSSAIIPEAHRRRPVHHCYQSAGRPAGRCEHVSVGRLSL